MCSPAYAIGAGGATERMVTAQINELMTEKAALLGTIVGNCNRKGSNPMIARVFDIEARQEHSEVPQILQIPSMSQSRCNIWASCLRHRPG